MRKNITLLISITVIFISCNQKQTVNINSSTEAIEASTNVQDKDAYTLMKSYCYVCHNPKVISHDSLLAPPFVAVKRRYTMQYQNKEAFVAAVVSWATKPTEDKALMKGAVTEFKVMPPLPLGNEILQKIATYIYDNDIEKPDWFESHFNEMHPNGMGRNNNNNKY